MRGRAIAAIAVFCFMGAVTAFADEGRGVYLSAKAGTFGLDDAKYAPPGDRKIHFEEGNSLSLAAGYDFGFLRVEAEYGSRENNMATYGEYKADGSYEISSYLLNGFVDFENSTFVTPYIGLGIGIADIESVSPLAHLNDSAWMVPLARGSETVTAYQGFLGVGFEIGGHVLIDVEWNFFTSSDPSFQDPVTATKVKSSYAGSSASAGLRYIF